MKWFIYYFIDKEYFLFGNSEYIYDVIIFCIEECLKIFFEKIYFLKILKNKEELIEYYI